MQDRKFNSELFLKKYEKLLVPIPGENPCGEYLRRNPLLIQIKELRNKLINTDEDLGIWSKKNEELPTWNDVIRLCEEFLINNSKDLQVCSYLAEAKLHTEGFKGLVGGLHLIMKLCTEYWNIVNPPLKDDEVEIRLAPFKWLQINLPLIIQKTPLAFDHSSEETDISYTWFWYQKESILGTAEGIKAKNILIDHLEKSDINELSIHIASLREIISILNVIENDFLTLIDDQNEDVTFAEFVNLCSQIVSFLDQVYLANVQRVNPSQNVSSGEKGKLAMNNNNQKILSYSGGEFSSIEEAYKVIEMANRYLIANDSHSPAPYLVRRAIEWRKKSLYGVLMELFTTTSKPQEIFTLLGLSHLDKNKSDN